MSEPANLPVAVLASGRGSNLEALIKATQAHKLTIRFTLVASDHADAPALAKAQAQGIDTLALLPKDFATRKDYDRALFQQVAQSGAKLVILAGFMRILDADVIAPWHGRIINIHPSLLPKYPGLNTHRQVLAAGDTHHGVSVHFVTAELDGGPVIAQARITIHTDDNEDTLAARLLPFEHQLFPAVVQLMAQQRLALGQNGIMLDNKTLNQPLDMNRHGELVRF